jgi:hypothetical protein
MLKIDGERIPGTVDQVRPIAGHMTIVVAPRRAAARHRVPGQRRVEQMTGRPSPNTSAVSEAPQNGPDGLARQARTHPAWAPSSGSLQGRPLLPNHHRLPSRELVRRPLLRHANLPVEQDTVPLLVSPAPQAAHRRVLPDGARRASLHPAAGARTVWRPPRRRPG